MHRLVGGGLSPLELFDLHPIGLVGEPNERLVNLERFPGGEQVVIGRSNSRQHIDPRFLQGQLGVVDAEQGRRAGQPQFVGRFDLLFDEHAVIVGGAARTDGIGLITNHRVGVKPRLNGLSHRRVDIGLSLGDQRIVAEGELFEVGQRHRRLAPGPVNPRLGKLREQPLERAIALGGVVEFVLGQSQRGDRGAGQFGGNLEPVGKTLGCFGGSRCRIRGSARRLCGLVGRLDVVRYPV